MNHCLDYRRKSFTIYSTFSMFQCWEYNEDEGDWVVRLIRSLTFNATSSRETERKREREREREK